MGEVSKHPEKTKMTTTPVHKVRAGNIQVDVWENEAEKNGQKFKAYSSKVTKSYKDKDGNWKTTDSLQTAEMPKVIELLREAYVWIISKSKDEE